MTSLIAPAAPIAPPEAATTPGEDRFLIHAVGYAQYLKLLEIFGDDGPRITYSDGMIEFMSPGRQHERVGNLLGRMVEAITEELDIPLVALSQVTLRRDDIEKGLEGDRSFYLANAARLDQSDHLDLHTTPPPDLIIEVEITASILKRLSIYAQLGVPEIWRHDGRTLRVCLLQPDGNYAESPQSRCLPFVPIAALNLQLQKIDPTNDTRWARAFRVWVREVVAPLYQP